MAASTRLSKTQFLRGLQCAKSLWLYNHRKDLLPQTPPGLLMLFEQGHEIGLLARRRYPGGRLILEDFTQGEQAARATAAAVAEGASCLFEAAAIHDRVLVRSDVLTLNLDKSWDLIEVKGSTEVKDEYHADLAVQRYVLEGAGLRVRRTVLLHVNNAYVRRGELDPEGFFTAADVTAEVAELLKDVPGLVKGFHKLLAQGKEPVREIGKQCRAPHDCEFIPYCWKDIPEYSVYDLTGIRAEKAALLRAKGVLELKDIPASFPLSENQRLQVDVEKSGQERVEAGNVAAFLKTLKYPVHYLDFETVNPAIPPYDGLKPYQKIPFQASVQFQERAGAPVKSLDYVGDGTKDPRPGLAAFLAGVIRPTGSVVAYNASFEAQCLEELAVACREHARPLLSAKSRLWDAAEPFRKRHYIHPAFRGSWSIKAVLPALVPDMTYKGLAVANGEDAQVAYWKLMRGELAEAERAQLLADLKAYCRQDTLAMVKVLEALRAKSV